MAREACAMTLGAIAELKIKSPSLLNDTLMHRIPTDMMIERQKIDAQIKANQEAYKKLCTK